MIWIFIIAAVFIVYVVWQKIELTKFKVTTYEINTGKTVAEINAVIVSDLHAHQYGENNERLIAAIEQLDPDLILIPGDLIVGKYTETYEISYEFLKKIVKIAPVYFSNGNHESRPTQEIRSYTPAFLEYQKRVEELGVIILNNEQCEVTVGGQKVSIYGLEIPLYCYEKGKKISLEADFIKKHLGEVNKKSFSILMAHNPSYWEQYADWGADLTVSGHTHGGLVRIPGIGSVISPQFELFPKYDAGMFETNQKKLIVSKGLGTHTFHIRIFDRAELIHAIIRPENH